MTFKHVPTRVGSERDAAMNAVFCIEKSINITSGPKDDYVLFGYAAAYTPWQANAVSSQIFFPSRKGFNPKPELHNVTNRKVELLQCIKFFSENNASKALQTCCIIIVQKIENDFLFRSSLLVFEIKAMKHELNCHIKGPDTPCRPELML